MEMNQYVFVAEEEGEEPIEVPTEDDGTLSLATLVAQFAGASGLKFRNPETGAFRGVRQIDGKLYAPDGVWSSRHYIACFPKDANDNKRKGEDGLENPTAKTKKLERRKCSDLIVLGLPWKSSEEDLRAYFSQFGELLMVQIKRDVKSLQSKGFGFIRFVEYEAQMKCLNQRHMIDGRWCDVRIPNSKGEAMQQQMNRKIFVGRCTEEITADDLRTYFAKFGEVVDVFIPKPFRAFAFVTFQDPVIAQALCGEDHIIRGTSVHLSSAAPRAFEKGDTQKSRKSNGTGAGQSAAWGTSNAGGRGGAGPQQANPFSNMGVGMPFPINPAMIAAAQAALTQGGWGALLGMATQNGVTPATPAGDSHSNQPVPMNTNAMGYNGQSNAGPNNTPGGYYTGSWSDGSVGQQPSWGQSPQAKPAGWN